MIFARFAPIVFVRGLVLVAWAALAVRPHVWDDRHSPVCTTDGLSTNKCEIAQLNPGISQLVPHLRDNGRQPRAVSLDGSVGHLRQTNGGSLRQHSAETTDGPPRAAGTGTCSSTSQCLYCSVIVVFGSPQQPHSRVQFCAKNTCVPGSSWQDLRQWTARPVQSQG